MCINVYTIISQKVNIIYELMKCSANFIYMDNFL